MSCLQQIAALVIHKENSNQLLQYIAAPFLYIKRKVISYLQQIAAHYYTQRRQQLAIFSRQQHFIKHKKDRNWLSSVDSSALLHKEDRNQLPSVDSSTLLYIKAAIGYLQQIVVLCYTKRTVISYLQQIAAPCCT